MKKIRIGVIGPGTICHRFIKGAQMVNACEVYAVAGRNKERAEKVALQYKIPYHGLIDDLIMDEHIDAVYVSTPNDTHYEIVKKCLMHGKHVLCEKPMFTTIEELDELNQLAYSKNLVLMEAMKALFLPLTQKVKQVMESSKIGDILYMDGKYSYKSDLTMDHWAYHYPSGGGMRDVGVYPLGYFNYLVNSDIKEIVSMSRKAETGVDAFTQALVRYENGAIMSYSLTAYSPKEGYRVVFTGTKGRIEAEASEVTYVNGSGDKDLEGATKEKSIKVYPMFGIPYDVEIPTAKGGHGGGDPVLLNDIFGTPEPDPLERAASHVSGAMSILTGIAANKSIATGRPVDIKDLVTF